MDTKRLILFVVFSFSVLLLWDSWQKQDIIIEESGIQTDTSIPVPPQASTKIELPQASTPSFKLAKNKNINVDTNLYSISINTVGGDIRELFLKKYLADEPASKYQLMAENSKPLLYVAQSGLLGSSLPTHKTIFSSNQTSYVMDADQLSVPLFYETDEFLVKKTYTFLKDSYLINVAYEIQNKSNSFIKPSAYYQFLHDGESNQGTTMMPSFTGTAYFTETENFNKLSFSDVDSKDFSLTSTDGWIGIIQRYFASSWIIPDSMSREFYSKKIANNVYASGLVTRLADIGPGETLVFETKLYAGPQAKENLAEAAEGMTYTVDYGWLTFIASPLFSVLSGIQKVISNWGVSIILLTVLIKLLFYPLSAASYRSMAQMRELAPRLQSMKEKFGDDKQKMQKAMMELYKTEKINPLGGCLPILIQIPVFIALYWVLLGSVELRNAPFLYIGDLSSKDPYFVLPLLMAISMFAQTKLNPKPTDPMQAKLMLMMPIIFSVFFFFFPAGLVLYWLVNNLLSILQQWYVNKTIHAAALKKKGNA